MKKCPLCNGTGRTGWHGNGLEKPPTSYVPCRLCHWSDYRAIFPDAKKERKCTFT